MYRNQEGYADPTAGAVMKKLMTEYNRKKRSVWRKAQRIHSLQQKKARGGNSSKRANPKEADKNDC